MPRLAPHQVPSYRLHKSSGQAIVTLSARDFLLGSYGSPESRRRYHELLARWEANERKPIHLAPEELRPADLEQPIRVSDLCDLFQRHADQYYRKEDRPTGEAATFRLAMSVLRDAFGHEAATLFGPGKLREVRSRMVKRGWVRTSVNIHVRRLRHVFKWAASHELLPATVHASLVTLEPLKRGRSDASEASPVRPVPPELIEAVRPHVSTPVWIMIQLQLLTGARPGELVKLRPLDMDRTESVWTYVPPEHKTMHHGHQRVICLGPRAQSLLEPLLEGRAPDAFVFDPRESIVETRRKAATKGKYRRPDQRPNTRTTTRRVCSHYTTSSYRRAIANACDRAAAVNMVAVQRWHPHQLRHNFGTEVRSRFGAEQAQIALGHRTMKVTEIYAERDLRHLRRVAELRG